MNLEVQAREVTSAADVRKFVACRVELALGPLRDRIEAVNVFVRRREDPDAGKAVRCLVVVKSGTRPDVVVEYLHGNQYVAIHRAVDEAGWALADSCVREQEELLNQQLETICSRAA